MKVTVGKPMVAYRQTLAKPVEFETRYIKQSGGRGKYAVIYCSFEPLTKEQIEEMDAEHGGGGREARPEQHLLRGQDLRRRRAARVHPVGGGTASAIGCVKGAKYGFPLRGHAGTLLDGKYHDVDSSAGHVQAGRDGVLPRCPGSRRASRCWSRS